MILTEKIRQMTAVCAFGNFCDLTNILQAFEKQKIYAT